MMQAAQTKGNNMNGLGSVEGEWYHMGLTASDGGAVGGIRKCDVVNKGLRRKRQN